MQLFGFWLIWYTTQSKPQILVSYRLHRLPETVKMESISKE